MTTAFCADWVIPVGAPPIANAAVVVADGVITALTARADVDADELVDYGEAAILPGLVNAHTHLEYAAFGALDDGVDFGPWMLGQIRRMTRLGADGLRESARLGALACLRSGVTAIGDCAYDGAALDAARDAGLRGVVHYETFGREPARALARLAALDDLEARTGERIRIGVSPHAPYTVARDALVAVAACARERGLRLATHVAESRAELEALAAGTGPLVDAYAAVGLTLARYDEHPVAALVPDPLVGRDATLVHCVEIGDEEIGLIAAAGVNVVTCPRSNAQLGCGAAPVTALRAAGVPVALGTDSPSSALDFDLFAELRALIATARTRERRAAALSAADALAMATIDGARVLGLEDEVGSLAVGKRADFVAVSLRDCPFLPTDDPIAAVVYGGSPERVLETRIDGRLYYCQEGDGPAYADAVTRARELRALMLSEAVLP